MNAPLPPSNSDDPENLLRSGLRETTPEFEQRWTDLKRELRSEPAPRRSFAGFSWLRIGFPASIAAAAAILLLTHTTQPRPQVSQPQPSPMTSYDDLLDLDATLSEATSLTNSENLDVLVNFVSANGHQT